MWRPRPQGWDPGATKNHIRTALRLAHPRAVLTPLGPDLWHLPAAPVRLPGGAQLPLATIVIRLADDGGLLLYAPAALDDAQAASIDALGAVTHLVAPCLYHHLHVAAAVARWPTATVHGAPGLAAKRPDLTIHHELGAPAWGGAIDVELIRGAPAINETVLFHRPSGTLVCADFVFHITQPANLRTRMMLALTGTGGRELRQSRIWRFAVKDRPAARASIERILAWPIEQLAPVHGEPLALDSPTLAARLRIV